MQNFSKLLIAILLLMAVGGTGAAVYFWRQHSELQSRLEKPAVANPQNSIKRLREGAEVPDFTARDIEGREVQVAARGKGNTLLFIYDPKCDRCEAGLESWSKVNSKLQELKAPVQVFALSVADSYTTVQHARRIKIPFTTVPFPNVDLQIKYGVTEVPLTVVVDPQGRVQALWDKPLTEGEAGDVIETVCPDCLKPANTNNLANSKEEK